MQGGPADLYRAQPQDAHPENRPVRLVDTEHLFLASISAFPSISRAWKFSCEQILLGIASALI